MKKFVIVEKLLVMLKKKKKIKQKYINDFQGYFNK